MKIISLKAENFKRIKAVEITPNGEAVVIQGANAQGKTSVLDSIAYALSSMAIKKPIRDGEEKAKIEIDLGEYLVKKVATGKGSYLKIETKEGAELKSPQKILDKIVGQISFDPLNFSRMKANEQRLELVKMIPALDFTKLDEKRKHHYDHRTEIGRALKSEEAELEGIYVPENTPDKTIDVKEKMAEVNHLAGKIFDEETKLAENLRAQEKLVKLVDDFAEKKSLLLQEIEVLDHVVEENKKELHEIGTPALSEEVVIWKKEQDEAKFDIEQAATINEAVIRKGRWNTLDAQIRNSRTVLNQQTAEIEKIDKEKKMALEIVPMPIPGLGITENYVTYEGIPFSDLAESEKLKISFSMAMAQNPELKVVFIRDGSLLDTSSRAQVIEMAKEKDYQVWLEVTEDNATSGIIIEDGQIV